MLLAPPELERFVLNASDHNAPTDKRNHATEVLNSLRNSVPLDTTAQNCLQLLYFTKKSQPLFFAWSTLQHCLNISLAHECNPKARTEASQPRMLGEERRDNIRRMILNVNNSPDANLSIPNEAFLRTKIAVVLALLIQLEFPLRWPTAFNDLTQMFVVNSSTGVSQDSDENESMLRVDLYLRTLHAFCDEIVDRNANPSNSADEQSDRVLTFALHERNTVVRDVMRGLKVATADNQISNIVDPSAVNHNATIVGRLMETLVNIANFFSPNDRSDLRLASLALSVMKRFIPWIDQSLIVNKSVIPLLFSCYTSGLCTGEAEDDINTAVAIQATDCLYELVIRGMVLRSKIQLLTDLQLFPNLIRDHSSNVHNNASGLLLNETTNIHLAIKMAQLVDATGLELLECWEKEDEQRDRDELKRITSSLLHQFIPAFFACFMYDDIDVTGAVLPVANSMVVSLGKEFKKDQQQREAKYRLFSFVPHLPQLLSILYQQMQYPPDFQFDYNSEDDAEEQVFRHDLRKLYVNIVRSCPNEITLQFLCQIFANGGIPNIPPISAAPPMHLEAALRLLFHYSEGIRPVRSSVPSSTHVMQKMEPFHELVLALHQSDISQHPHQEILLLYFDIAVRYLEAFKKNAELLPSILDVMSGPRGLQHTSSARVRSRSCYLMLRLVKGMSAGGRMKGFVENAVRGIQGLLSTPELSLQDDDTLYLFETMGLLLGTPGNLSAEDQAKYLTAVVSPHMHSIELALRSPLLLQDPLHYGTSLSQSIAAISYLSKGFGHDPQENVQRTLAGTLNVSLHVLQALPAVEEVRNKTMILIQRMIYCLKKETLINALPSFLRILIDHCTSEDILNVSQMLNQICIKYRRDAVRALGTAVIPFVQKCESLVLNIHNNVTNGAHDVVIDNENKTDNVEGNLPPHLEVEQESIKKLSYSVLQHVVKNDATVILLSQINTPHLENIFQLMLDGAVKIKAPSVMKTCISFFQCLVVQWAKVCDGDRKDNQKQFLIIQEGFLRFLYRLVVPNLLKCILSLKFKHRDAMQARNLNEIGLLLNSIKVERGQEEFVYQVIEQTLTRIYNCDNSILEAFRDTTNAQETVSCLKIFIEASKKGIK